MNIADHVRAPNKECGLGTAVDVNSRLVAERFSLIFLIYGKGLGIQKKPHKQRSELRHSVTA